MGSGLSEELYKTVEQHIISGIPIDMYKLTQNQQRRIKAVFHLYKAWRDDPFVQPRVFLEHVCHRATGDIANDLRLFAFIKSKATEEVISITDARYIADIGIRRLFQHADTTGDDHTLDIAMKHLAKWHNPDKEKEESDNTLPANAPVIFTRNIQDIAPDYESVDTPARRRLLEKYNGLPDENTEMVERRAEELMVARNKQSEPSIEQGSSTGIIDDTDIPLM